MAAEIVTNLTNEKIALREQVGEHPLKLATKTRATDDAGAPTTKADASWESLPAKQRASATENVDVYLDDFISVVQGGPRDRCQILWHLFNQIDRVFRPNKDADTDRKYPISLKKLGKVDG